LGKTGESFEAFSEKGLLFRKPSWFLRGENLPTHRSETALSLTLEDSLIATFFQLLQQGFMVKVRVGCSIKDLLCRQLGLDPQYLEQRIQTIFLNGKPVDDIDSAIVEEGAILALSSAMPGLVGAILRRGGPYALMRSRISIGGKTESLTLRKGFINLKLFNLVAKELGPAFLNRGVWVSGKNLEDLMKGQSTDFWRGCLSARVEGDKVGLDKLAETNWSKKRVFLQLQSP
jgi:hypothetical protein